MHASDLEISKCYKNNLEPDNGLLETRYKGMTTFEYSTIMYDSGWAFANAGVILLF